MPRGRPKIEIDYESVRELASENNTVSDICRVLHISRQAFYNRKEAVEAFEDGRAEMRVQLNHWQWQEARNNPAMQIHLGKQVLGQGDKPQDDGANNAKETAMKELVDALRGKNDK